MGKCERGKERAIEEVEETSEGRKEQVRGVEGNSQNTSKNGHRKSDEAGTTNAFSVQHAHTEQPLP